MATRNEAATFTGATGARLAASLELPAGRPRAYALFAHCFTCSKDNFAATRIARALAERDIATLRFDFTGLGHSEGDFANTGFSSNVADLVAAADFLRAEHAAPALLVGHSLGGAAVLKAAAAIPESRAVATIGAPSSPAHLTRLLSPARAEIEAKGEAEITLGGRTFRITRAFLEDVETASLNQAIAGLRRALLILHSPRDPVVSVDCAAEIFQAAKHPKSFVSLDDADHLLSRRADAVYVADLLAAWAGRYLAAPQAAPHAAEDTGVLVEENGAGPYGQDIVTGPHLLHADEPPDVGGRDGGPTPYQLLSAALGACTSMTLRMYADRKNWKLDRATVTVHHQKIHASDCENCENSPTGIDRFDRDIRLDGALDDAQRQRMMEIADKCPVHRTLHGTVRVVTRLVP